MISMVVLSGTQLLRRGKALSRICTRLQRQMDSNEWSLTFLWVSAILGVAAALSS